MDGVTTRVNEAVGALKGLCDPTRLRLLMLLSHGEFTVGELCRVLGQSQPRVSRHLKLLSGAGFLDRFREQQCVYYRAPAAGARPEWLRQLLGRLDPQDPALRRDRVRMAVVVSDRARAAVGALGAAHSPLASDARLAALLRTELGPAALGELLDVGTGAGRMLELLGGQASRAVGLDLSTAALRLARTRVHGLGLAHCEFQCGDMYGLPWEADAFDTLTIDRVLAGAERPLAVLHEAARVLRPGGRLLVIEGYDALEACTGANPLQQLRAWLAGAGLSLQRLAPCELESGHHLLALARAA
jgi:SAM-dependent methyltransferase/DNA-binding transcriptional ArsR family regulator